VLDGLRAEFPALSGVRMPRLSVARESPWWAFLSGMGAAFVVGGIVRLAVLVVLQFLVFANGPRSLDVFVLFHDGWLSTAVLAETTAAIAAGAVLMRAGSAYALLLYIAFELLRLLAGIPGRLTFCDRSGFPSQPPPPGLACDIPSMIVAEWPTFGALIVGALVARALLTSSGAGANPMLRGAGAYGLLAAVFSMVLGLTTQNAGQDQQVAITHLMTIAQVIAGAVAGVILARASLAAAVLVVLLLIGLPLSFALPNALVGGGSEPAEFAMMRWAAVYIPVLAGAAILAARGYARRQRGGTFF
jgi:hypothetical protein